MLDPGVSDLQAGSYAGPLHGTRIINAARSVRQAAVTGRLPNPEL